MSDNTPLEEMALASSKRGRDPKTRKILLGVVALWLITLAALLGFAWNAYFNAKATSQSLAQQITHACNSGDFGPGLNDEDEKKLCAKAKKVVDNSGSVNIGVQGPPGPEGPRGPQGIQGPMGLQGIMGVNGRNGKNGLDGGPGDNGPPGPQGLTGAKGDTGDTGPAGADGKDGANGADGTPAVPFTFTFTVPGNGLSPGHTFSCTVTTPDSQVTCQEAQ